MLFRRKPVRPTAGDVAHRVLALEHVTRYAYLTPTRDMMKRVQSNWSARSRAQFARESGSVRDEYWAPALRAGLWRHLSPAEKAFARTTLASMDRQAQMDAGWRIEALQALMWALGLVEALPPYDTQAPEGLLTDLRDAEMRDFALSASLRPEAEVDRARDIAELWHWRSRTRQLIEEGRPLEPDEKMIEAGLRTFDDIVRMTAREASRDGMIPPAIDEDFPAKGKAYRDLTADEWSEVGSITVERHFALNWLCGYAPRNRWDDTPTDT